MFNLKIINESYNGSDSLYNVINYVIRDKETHEYLLYIGGLNIFDVTNSYNEMMYIKEAFRKSDKRQLRHFVVSFSDRCLFIPYDSYLLGYQIAAYYGGNYQIIFGVHNDSEHLHIHFVMNSVSFRDGRKYSGAMSDLIQLEQYIKMVVQSYLEKQ